MSEEEAISLLAEMMAAETRDAVLYRNAAQRLWNMASGLGLEEDLSEIALAYELAVSSIMAKDG